MNTSHQTYETKVKEVDFRMCGEETDDSWSIANGEPSIYSEREEEINCNECSDSEREEEINCNDCGYSLKDSKNNDYVCLEYESYCIACYYKDDWMTASFDYTSSSNPL